jgi:secreted PhoX family phosphatase
MALTRRQFVRAAAVSAGFAGLNQYLSAQAPASIGPQPYLDEVEGYGPLVADPKRILDLPRGFSYRILSHTGNTMDDGFLVPGAPDGMAAFAGNNGRVILVRNHELGADAPTLGAFGWTYELLPRISGKYLYDGGKGQPHLGGTTTLVYDPASGKVESQFLSLVGTNRNCAGGPTPWGSWISCEENVDIASDVNEKDHGYAFEVPAKDKPGLTEPRPLKAMGRFYREAVAVDPRTGIVYQTEDRVDGLIYRYIPEMRGNLAAGGRLQALAVRDRKTCDTRNFGETGAPRLPVGEWLPVRWLDIDNVDTQRDDLRVRGAGLGAALFARGEGMWYGTGELFFACTNGGLSQRGQVFRYAPSAAEGTAQEDATPGRLQLYLEPNNAQLLESCDNVTVAPWGDLLLCEDNAAPATTVVRQTAMNYVRGVTPAGKIYTFARNRYPALSELAGACFAPNHPTLFLNIQTPGFTLAITGPWADRKA